MTNLSIEAIRRRARRGEPMTPRVLWSRTPRYAVMFIAAAFLPVFSLMAIAMIWPQIMASRLSNLIMVGLASLGCGAMLDAATKQAREIRARLREGEAPCPKCGFDLSELPQLGMGRTHCPECGLTTVAHDELRELWRGTLIMWRPYWTATKRQRDIQQWRLRYIAEFPLDWDEFKPDHPNPPAPEPPTAPTKNEPPA